MYAGSGAIVDRLGYRVSLADLRRGVVLGSGATRQQSRFMDVGCFPLFARNG